MMGSSILTRFNGIIYEVRAMDILKMIEECVIQEHFAPSRTRMELVQALFTGLREENTGESYHEARAFWKLYSARYPDDAKRMKNPIEPRWGWPDWLGFISH